MNDQSQDSSYDKKQTRLINNNNIYKIILLKR